MIAPFQIEAKVLATSWPELKGKTRHDAEAAIKATGREASSEKSTIEARFHCS